MNRVLYLFVGVLCLSMSACSTQSPTSTESAPVGGCGYDKHSIFITIDSIVSVGQSGPQDTAKCEDCSTIYYHTVSNEQLSTKCFGTIGGQGESQLVNGSKYYTRDLILKNDLVAKGQYLMQVDELVSGSGCDSCVIGFTKKAP